MLVLAYALIAVNVLGALASPIGPEARDSNEPLVVTPGGLRPQSQVHFVPPGARVHHALDAVQIVSADGSILHSTPSSPSIRNSLTPRSGLATGYVAYSYWTGADNSNPITSFSSTWGVPAAPKTNHDQLLYLFNALTPASDDAILQPVLQYGTSGAGGGNYWAIAAWYVTTTSTYHSTLVPVQSGSSVNGVMALKSVAAPAVAGGNSTYTYNAQFTHSPYATITVTTSEVLNWAWEALEIYSATVKTDLPTGKTAMSNITLTTQNGSHPPLTWTTVGDLTDGLAAKVVIDGSAGGEVDIMFS